MNYALIYLIYSKELNKFRAAEIEVNRDREMAVKTLTVFMLVLLLFITEVYPISLTHYLVLLCSSQ